MGSVGTGVTPGEHEPGEGSTPEVVASYWGSRDATWLTLRTLRVRVTAAVTIVALFVIVAVSVFLTNQDAKSSDTNAKVSAVRTAQQHNTKVSNERAACQIQALDAVLQDVNLAFSGDRNASDYAPVPKC